MKQVQLLLLLLLPLFLLYGCDSAEAIKFYSYRTTKSSLESAVIKVIENNPKICIDNTIRLQSDSIGSANRRHWTSEHTARFQKECNELIEVKIKNGEGENYYLFDCRENLFDWETNKKRMTAIIIDQAEDKNGNSLPPGENEHGEFKSKIAKELTGLFEEEIVSKVDKELHLQHTNIWDN